MNVSEPPILAYTYYAYLIKRGGKGKYVAGIIVAEFKINIQRSEI